MSATEQPLHPARAILEAASVGEAVGQPASSHLRACEECQAYLRSLESERETFLRARPKELFRAQLAHRRAAPARPRWGWRWLVAGGPVLAVASVALFLSVRPSDVTLKGRRLTVVVKHPGKDDILLVAPDSQLGAGDALRFRYDAPASGYLMVLDRDGSGKASVFYPVGADASAPLSAHAVDFLPGAIELDATPGPEWLVAVFSERPQSARDLTSKLAAVRDPAALSCAGCSVDALRLDKKIP